MATMAIIEKQNYPQNILEQIHLSENLMKNIIIVHQKIIMTAEKNIVPNLVIDKLTFTFTVYITVGGIRPHKCCLHIVID